MDLPVSPTDLGAVRPYSEVYAQYTGEARETLGRSPLPPTLENLVWRYFSSLEPVPGQR
ncbi:MAG: hypothetical protein PWP65_1809 [Clostridia bacterium]|nr:hypothetical protein [Clostridia bacterium]